MRVALVFTVLIAMHALPRSASACDEEAVRRAAERVRPAQVAGPRPRAQSSRCVSVSVLGPELGPPSLGTFVRAACTSVAFAYRWTVVRTETCGNDVHFDPEHVGGVVVLELSGSRLRVRARGSIGPELLESLELGPPSDEDGDGRQEITKTTSNLPARSPVALEIRGRAIVRRRSFPPARPHVAPRASSRRARARAAKIASRPSVASVFMRKRSPVSSSAAYLSSTR